MDDRKPSESNVVRLHRDGEPDEEERRRLARTIFASEDDVGTFSRGNLLLPPPNPPPHEEPPAEPDPFFEQFQDPDQSATRSVPLGGRDDTVAYFEKLGSQTAAEMSVEATGAQPSAMSMPGSARLPAEINKPRRRATRRDRAATSKGATAEPTGSRRRPRLAMAPVAAATGVLVIAGAALAAIVAGNGHTDATHRPIVTRQNNPGPAAARAFLASITAANKERARTAQRRTGAQHSSRTQRQRHLTGRRQVAHAAKSTTTPPPSSSSVASTAPVSGTQSVQSSPAPQEPASTARSSASGSSGSGGSSASHQPVWGANGILGPGHSPNG